MVHSRFFDYTVYINEMMGFRIMQGDTALCHFTSEPENHAVFLVEYGGKRGIRQLRRLDADRLMLLHNPGKLQTETVSSKNVKILARIDRIEIRF